MRTWVAITVAALGAAAVESLAEEVGTAPGMRSPEPRARTAIEEIVVTAQKTEQTLREVPISISVVDGEFLKQESITDYRDLALFVPNVSVTGSAIFDDVRVRGFGSQLANVAFEEAVGLVIDGVSYGRRSYFQSSLFDLERVEVLRGPQGTLFGKNTTAGVFNVVTKKPTGDYTGFLGAELGELDRRRLEAALGGPIVENLVNFRIAALSDERNGTIENTTARFVAGANARMQGRERRGLRAQLGFPNLLGADLNLAYEKVDVELVGTGWESTIATDNVAELFRQYDPAFDRTPDNFVGSIDKPELAERAFDTFTANAGYDLGGWRIAAVAGYAVNKTTGGGDADLGPAPIFDNGPNTGDTTHTTFEIRSSAGDLPGLVGLERLFGVPLGRSDLTIGIFYQRQEIDSVVRVGLNAPVLAQYLAAQNLPPEAPVPPLADFIGPEIPLGDLGPVDTRLGFEQFTNWFDQRTDSLAGFTHLSWRFLERWALEPAMRLTYEKKEADLVKEFTAGTGLAFGAVAGQEEFAVSRSLDELAFTPRLSLRWDWTDEVGLFATWARGFKSGGFNAMASNAGDEIDFDAERATSYEAGAKARLFDGTATLNVSLFRQDVEDLQVFTLRPENNVTLATNAGKARAQGVEADATWLAASWLTIVAALALNDTEFLSFPLGTCAQDREDTDGDGDPRCDHAGQPFYRTPKWVMSLTPSLTLPFRAIPGLRSIPMAADLDLIGGGTMEYQDTQYIFDGFDERGRLGSFFRFAVNAGVRDLGRGWTARFTVQNLTNEATAVTARDLPSGPGNWAQLPEPPRLFFGSLQWRF